MKIQDYCRTHKKKVVIIVVSLVTVLVIAGGAAFFFLRRTGGNGSYFQQENAAFGSISISGDIVSASGITSVGMTQENFEVENLTEGLLVEEVYAASGDEMQEGDAILKLSEESVAEVREELEKTLREADLAYRAGIIEYEQSRITARYDRDMAVLEGEQAKEVYDETIASLASGVERAQEALDEANEKIAEYQEIIAGGDYYVTYKVGEYKSLYEDNLRILTSKMEEWGVTWSQVVSGSGQSAAGAGLTGTTAVGSASASVSGSDIGSSVTTASSGQLSILQSLYRVLEQNLQDYEQAQEDYEDAVANAELNLQTLELSLSSLKEALVEAQSDYDTQVLQAKLTYEKTLASAARADSDYETALEKAESDYEELKEAKEDAEENLALFENSVGDGYYYAAGSGTILRVMIRAGQYLTSDSTIFLYTNPEEMSVTVSVDQTDIATVAVGEEAYVESAEYGSFQGVVTQIDPVSQSGSRTNVTYNVTVELTGNTGDLQTNTSVTVLFGLGGTGDEETN